MGSSSWRSGSHTLGGCSAHRGPGGSHSSRPRPTTSPSRKSQSLPQKMETLLQLVFASLVVTCGLVNGQSADYDPLYIGKFEDLAHSVGGDIFVLDDKTIYIQDFSHDGQAPDVFFWADGVIIPYITRSNLEPQIGLQRFLPREDVVLLLPPEKPTIHSIDRLEVWCRAFGISFGNIEFPLFERK